MTQAGDDEPAMKAFREAIRIMPDYADAHANLGAALTSTTMSRRSANWKKKFALAPDSVKAQYNLAVAYSTGSGQGTKEIDKSAR